MALAEDGDAVASEALNVLIDLDALHVADSLAHSHVLPYLTSMLHAFRRSLAHSFNCSQVGDWEGGSAKHAPNHIIVQQRDVAFRELPQGMIWYSLNSIVSNSLYIAWLAL